MIKYQFSNINKNITQEIRKQGFGLCIYIYNNVKKNNFQSVFSDFLGKKEDTCGFIVSTVIMKIPPSLWFWVVLPDGMKRQFLKCMPS